MVSRSGRNLSHGPTHLPKMAPAAKPIRRQLYWKSPAVFFRLSLRPNSSGVQRSPRFPRCHAFRQAVSPSRVSIKYGLAVAVGL